MKARGPVWMVAGAGLVLGLGATAHASGGLVVGEPDPAAVARWCGLEQQGAQRLAADLRLRERELDAREQGVAARSAEMKAAEERLAARVAELEALRAALDVHLTEADGERAARVQGLVKMIEAGRGKAMAPMFAALDPALAVEVLDRMNRAKAGRLLAELPPATAADLAERMARPVALELP